MHAPPRDAASAVTKATVHKHVRQPGRTDDKYRRGVLGVITGSSAYPGAAVLGVEAAIRCGVGMVRYVGPPTPSKLVLQRRPEAVLGWSPAGGPGKVQAWLLGSGVGDDDSSARQLAVAADALAEGVPTVIDAGGLALFRNPALQQHKRLRQAVRSRTVITPHAGELSTLFASCGRTIPRVEIEQDPGSHALRASEMLGVTVVLKGNTTCIASDGTLKYALSGAPTWLATAGSGDVLAGILGGLLAINPADDPADLAATAVWLHGQSATAASGGGPIAALDVAQALPGVIATLLSEAPTDQ